MSYQLAIIDAALYSAARVALAALAALALLS